MHPTSELDDMIAQEKRQVALEYHDEAWAGGLSDGIDTDIMAEAAIETAMRGLIEAIGEDAALAYVDALRERVLVGAFVEKTLQ